MAKIIFSGVGITEMRGKFGGTVASRNANGAFIRNRVNPVNPQTARQIAVRGSFAQNSGAWRGLSDTERSAWSDIAPTLPYQDALGQSKVYTGPQLFMKVNGSLAQIGGDFKAFPPAQVSAPNLGASGLTFLVDTAASPPTSIVSFEISPATIPAGFVLVVYATPGLSAGIMRPQAGLFRRLAGTPVIAAGDVDISNMYSEKYSAPVPGQKVYIRVLLTSEESGQSFIVSETAIEVDEA